MSIPDHHMPAECLVCKRHAIGIGLGNDRTLAKPQWLCVECALLCNQIRSVKRLDMYEVAALDDAGNEGGEYLDTLGKTDVATLNELEFREFIKRVMLGFGGLSTTAIADLTRGRSNCSSRTRDRDRPHDAPNTRAGALDRRAA